MKYNNEASALFNVELDIFINKYATCFRYHFKAAI